MSAALRARLFWRLLFLQAAWSFQGMQNLGFAFAIKPFLDRAYPDLEERRQALLRHLGFFNTQPYMAGLILGLCCRLEQRLAAAPASERAALAARLQALKTACSAALAGIGDTLFWASLRPACAALALCVSLAFARLSLEAAAASGAAVYLLAYNLPALWLRWKGLEWGYAWDEEIAIRLKQLPWQPAIARVRQAGLALSAAAAVLFLARPGAWAGERLLEAGAIGIFAVAERQWGSAAGLYAAAAGAGMLASAAGVL